MDIVAKNVGKRFRKNWIFRSIDLEVPEGSRQAILGPNGSGKSTLLQIISSMTLPSEGQVKFMVNGVEKDASGIYRHISMAAPYMQLFETLTLRESIDMHYRFKNWNNGVLSHDVPDILQLEKFTDQCIGEFSSGMKQRVKLGLAILSDVDTVLLDEPASNLDRAGRTWYLEMVEKYASGKSFVVCSNHMEEEYEFCTGRLDLGPR